MKTRKTVAFETGAKFEVSSCQALQKCLFWISRQEKISSFNSKTLLTSYRVLEVLEAPRRPFAA